MFCAAARREKGQSENPCQYGVFVPKPFTPFQWVGQASEADFQQKIDRARGQMRDRKITYRWHEPAVSRLEAVLARGDRRLAPVLADAMEGGSFLDSWEEHLKFEAYEEAFRKHGVDPAFLPVENGKRRNSPMGLYRYRRHKRLLWREYEKSLQGEITPDCRDGCAFCGAGCFSIDGVSPCVHFSFYKNRPFAFSVPSGFYPLVSTRVPACRNRHTIYRRVQSAAEDLCCQSAALGL